MKIRISVILGACIMSFIFISAARADGFKEGQWKMTMVTKMDNQSPEMANAMKQMQNLPPQALAMMKQRGISVGSDGQGMSITVTQCLSKQNPVPKQEHGNNNCKETHEINGDTVTFTSSCNYNNTQMDSNGTVTYAGDGMTGHITSSGTAGGHPVKNTIDITGQYVGPCPS